MSNGPEPFVGLVWYAAVDPTIGPGIVAPMWQFLVRTDTTPNELYWKSGAVATAWTLISGGGAIPGGPTVFSYVVTGVEPDRSALVIPLPAARAAATYLVAPAQQTATFGLAMNVPNASKTLVHFVLQLSAPATAGDVFSFYVADAF